MFENYGFQMQRSTLLSASFFVLISFLNYYQALPGFFILDDYPNFYGLGFVDDTQSAINYLLTAPAGERWLSYASFLPHITAWQSGNAFPFKLFNILLHATNAVLVCILLINLSKKSRFTISSSIIVLTAALWFLHPVHVNAVLYSVQRMTLLAGFFVLAGLCYQQWFFNYYGADKKVGFFSWLLFSAGLAFITILGVLSKENAVLLPALGFILLTITGQSRSLAAWQKLLTYAAPYVLLLFYLIFANKLGYTSRNFDMLERLLSQVLILKEYIVKLLLPTSSSFSLYYDGFKPIRSIFEARFLQAIVFWSIVFALAVSLRKKAPYLLFGIIWFLTAHALESTIIPLELYFDHRNYLASIGVFLAVLLAAQQLALYAKKQMNTRLQAMVILVLFVVIANWLYVQYSESTLWSDKTAFEKAQVKKQPNSLRALQGYVEVLFAEGKLSEAVQVIEYIHKRFGYYPTHIIFQATAACLANEDEKINHTEILTALKELQVDRSISDAMQYMLQVTQKNTCGSFSYSMYERYTRALLANPTVRSHAHNLVFLLVQSYIDRNDYQQALEASYLLTDQHKTQQFWFLQLGLATGLGHKQEAKQIYDTMLRSKQVNNRLFANELETAKQKIEALE